MRPWSIKRHKCLVGVEGGQTAFARHVTSLKSVCHIVAFVPWDRREEFVGEGSVEFVCEKKRTGTGSKLLTVARRYPDRNVIVVYGDVWYNDSCYARMLMHLPCTDVIKIMTELPPEDRKDWRGIVVVKDRAVVGVPEEKAYDSVESPEFHAALDCFGSQTLRMLSRELHGPDLDLMDDVVQHAIANGIYVESVLFPVRPAISSADLGTPERYAGYVCRAYRSRIGYPEIHGEATAAVAVLKATRIFTIGNGGSLRVAQHAALDWSKAGYLNAQALCDSGMVTAYGNDEDFTEVFAQQVETVRVGPVDVLVCFSVSGNSPNIVKAAVVARERGAKVVAVTYSASNYLVPLSHHAALIPGPLHPGPWSYGPIEDGMQVWAHAVTAVAEGLAPR